MGQRRTHSNTTETPRRVLVGEAAQALGISEGAVRMRVKRDTLPSAREGGRLYVLLDAEPTDDPTRPHDRTSELIAVLRQQLEAERQGHAEARRLLMAALERIPPQLEAPADSAPDARGSPERDEEQQGRGDVQSEGQTATSRRPWWRRVFGSE